MEVIFDNLDYFLVGNLAQGQVGGLLLTLIISFLSGCLSLCFGSLLACWVYLHPKFSKTIIIFSEIIHSIPLIFVIFWFWYLIPFVFKDIYHSVTLILALSFWTTFFVFKALFASLNALAENQKQAALSQGFSEKQILRLILLPQALKNATPALISILIALIKDTSLAFVINVPELTTVANQINNREQIYSLSIFAFIAFVYYVLCFTLSYLVKVILNLTSK